MRATYWALGWKGQQLWWLLTKDGRTKSDVGASPYEIVKFGTRDRAEGRRFFMMTKYAGDSKFGRLMSFDAEDLRVLKIRVERLINGIRVVNAERD